MAHKIPENATPAAVARTGSNDISISTRKIDNGYVTRVSEYNRDSGEFTEHEQFSAGRPAVSANVSLPQEKSAAISGALAAAIGKLKGTKK